MQVFDKIIPQGYADQIEADLKRTQFDWHYISDVTNRDYGSNSGFVHIAHDMGAEPSFWLPFIKPIIYSIEEATNQRIEQLLRIRVGLLTKTAEPDYEYNTPHVDFLFPHMTACYYVSDSDGDTVEFEQHRNNITGTDLNESIIQNYVQHTKFTVANRCSPKKGRLCVFDGLKFHSSTKPKIHDTRMVITINYIPYAS